MIAWNRRPARDPQHAGRPAGDDPCDPQPGDPPRRDLRRRRLDRADVDAVRWSRSGHRAGQTRQQPRPPRATRCCRASTRASRRRSAASSTRRSRRCRTATTSTKAYAPARPSPTRCSRSAPTTARAAAQPVFTPGTQPGDYQPTPPAFAQPAFTQWPLVRPFALRQRKPVPARPAAGLTSKAYTAAFKEVKSLGAITSTSRTADQTQIGTVLEPADLDRVEQHRRDGGARPPRHADAERAAVRAAQRQLRRLGDRASTTPSTRTTSGGR